MKALRIIVTTGIIVAAAGYLIFRAPNKALAQNAAAMSCQQLWYARNAIYARNGYCFTTEQAQAVFGAGCFPPYGRLGGREKDRVNEIQSWERRKGC
jgi:hypothetical protein